MRAVQSLTEAAVFNSGLEASKNLGENPYTILAFCPALTSIYSENLSGRMAGLVVGQALNTNATNFLRIEDFADP